MICAESGSTQVKASSFNLIAYVHLFENPYNLFREAYSALRVHINTFKLLEEKNIPALLTSLDFAEIGGVSPRFVIIDDGWKSINYDDGDNPYEDAKNLILGGPQMTARLHIFEECDKFKSYKRGLILGSNAHPFDPNKAKALISKGIELECLVKDRDKAVEYDLAEIEARIEKAEECGLKDFTRDLWTQFKGLDDIYVCQ
ncbi:hypothetical protein AHAS_Ahas13G0247900 [Arachis hypogaea]